VLAAIKAARERGFGISLRGLDFANLNREVLAAATHVELDADSDFPSRVKLLHDLGMPSLQLIARRVTSWEEFDVCTKLGAHVFAGNLHLSSRNEGNPSIELNPSQTLILRLMEMVRCNCDVRELEDVLKHDAVVAYKLLRYINSAGLGLGSEVLSLRHAVALLGYAPLYRWLALLLATATTTGFSPVLLHMAVLRGRFSELLGRHFLPSSEAENLFVAGLFSLLDKLLGVPMEDVLDKVQLSESIMQALLTREGMYSPFLAMAEACELNSADVQKVAMSLCVSAKQVNDAHLSALIWALRLDL
jgi:EAL and modified HD-GYP domain-containing signal transduction protein